MNLVGRDYALIIFAFFAIVGLLTPVFRRVAISMNILDAPSEQHKTHTLAIPYLGGVAIIVGTLIVVYSALLFRDVKPSFYLLSSSVLIPAFLMGIMGLIDDIKKLEPGPRFLMQNMSALITSFFIVKGNTFGSPTGSKVVDLMISMVWIVGITNSINFFDNVDGGASVTILFTSATLTFLTWNSQQVLLSALAATIFGSVSGFFVWNRPPARIYMGDAGSLFLGMLIASFTIRLDPTPINKWASLSVPLLLLAVPCIDTSVAVLSRLRRRISPFQGGRDHLSHRILRLGFSKRQTLLILGTYSALFSAIAIVVSYAPFRLEGIVSALGICMIITSVFLFLKTSDS